MGYFLKWKGKRLFNYAGTIGINKDCLGPSVVIILRGTVGKEGAFSLLTWAKKLPCSPVGPVSTHPLHCCESTWKPGALPTRVVVFTAWSTASFYQKPLQVLSENPRWDLRISIFNCKDQGKLDIVANCKVLQLTCRFGPKGCS